MYLIENKKRLSYFLHIVRADTAILVYLCICKYLSTMTEVISWERIN